MRFVRAAVSSIAATLAACGPPSPRPAAVTTAASRPALQPIRVWSNRALGERCSRPVVASAPASTAPVDTSSPPPTRRVELPPALARYPLLGRVSTGCGSPSLYTYCSMATRGVWSLPEFEPPLPPPHGPLLMMFGDARDCVTHSALDASLERDQFAACFDATSLPCGHWQWVSAAIRVDRPHDGRLTAMSGHEAVSMATANCLARAFRATHWVDHEGDAPVSVNVVIAWTDSACFR